MNTKFYTAAIFCFALFSLSSCVKKNGDSELIGRIVKQYKIAMSTTNENFIVASPFSTSLMNFQILDDKSINYEVFVDSANRKGDVVTAVEVRLGNPMTDNGQLLISLTGKFRAGWATGLVAGLRQSLLDTIMNNNIPKYINVLTGREPMGLVRGQINSDIVVSNNAFLLGNNFRPVVSTSTTGVAYIRVTADQNLYSKIVISNDEVSDPVQGALLNVGNVMDNTGVNISVLASNPGQLLTPKIVILTAAQFTQIVAGMSYASVTSAAYPRGKIGGQIK